MMVSAQASMRSLPAAVLGALAGIGTVAIIGVPTDVIPNPVFGRQTPVHAYDVAVLIALGVLTGALVATYAIGRDASGATRRAGIGSGVLGWFAVSCPACNKIVVALLGASGATSTFAPLQPALGGLAVALAAGALAVRIRALRSATCAVPRPAAHRLDEPQAGGSDEPQRIL
jgi:hypothetical protein